MTLDRIATVIAALGVPGLVLLVAVASTGLAGAAATTAGLARLGGPFGMFGGLAVLAILVLISHAIAKYGVSAISQAVVAKLIQGGVSGDEILAKIQSYPISDELKAKLAKVVSVSAGAR